LIGTPATRREERLHDPTRHWKFSLNDVQERKHWPAYQQAYEAVLTQCSTEWVPWYIVPANHKWYRNLVVAETIVRTLKALDLKYPPPTVDLAKSRLIERSATAEVNRSLQNSFARKAVYYPVRRQCPGRA
jgi:polyphosphate kinase 2 PPK2